MARLVGSSRAARQVGGVLKRLPKGSKLPWYRVINRKGKISLTGDDLSRQRKALQAEEIKVGAGMVPDGVTRVGEVEGTVVGAPLFVGISISGTAPASGRDAGARGDHLFHRIGDKHQFAIHADRSIQQNACFRLDTR